MNQKTLDNGDIIRRDIGAYVYDETGNVLHTLYAVWGVTNEKRIRGYRQFLLSCDAESYFKKLCCTSYVGWKADTTPYGTKACWLGGEPCQ
jgi:hypothetical protein